MLPPELQEPPEELTEAVYFNLSQLETLIIGIPEIIVGCEHRLKMFSGPKAFENTKAMITKNSKGQVPQDELVNQVIEENKALVVVMLDELPGIIREVKEAYQLLNTTVDKKKQIIIDPEWPPKIR